MKGKVQFLVMFDFFSLMVSELSTSIKALQYDLDPGEPKSQGGKRFFDTHAVVRLFEENGLASFVISTSTNKQYHSALLRSC